MSVNIKSLWHMGQIFFVDLNNADNSMYGKTSIFSCTYLLGIHNYCGSKHLRGKGNPARKSYFIFNDLSLVSWSGHGS